MKVLIYQRRIERNMTLMQLAKATGISKTALNDYENQKTSPRLCQLEQIARALNINITDLFEDDYL